MTPPSGPLARALQTRTMELRGRDLAPVTVAVLDSGIDGSHPDLAGRVVRAFACDVGEDGVVIRETSPDANNDVYGHGTGVASIIAGLAPNARIIDMRVLGNGHAGAGEATLRGLAHALEGEAQMLNLSLSVSDRFLPRLMPLCDEAYRQGKPILASRRNQPLFDDGYPAALIPCIGVDNMGAGPQDRWRYRSDIIEFAANGENITVAARGGGYTSMTGTSFATPVVAGHVCLLLGAYPGLRPFEIKALLKEMSALDAAAA